MQICGCFGELGTPDGIGVTQDPEIDHYSTSPIDCEMNKDGSGHLNKEDESKSNTCR